MRRFLMMFMALLCVTPALAAQPTDWSKVATREADGTYMLGNPDAKVKLVEFLSLTCPHCAKFEGEAIAPLTAKYIQTGQVSYEVRHALRDVFDFSASLLARCDGPNAFFAAAPVLYATQDQWIGKAIEWSKTAPDSANTPQDQLLRMVAKGSGLDQFFAARGLTEAKANACLANGTERDTLVAMANDAWHRPNFPGTPAFTINGVLQQDLATWVDLDKRLGAALKTQPTSFKAPAPSMKAPRKKL
ncbi:thioredoxin domain-containing protein [Sphingomonas sp. MMS24-J13]|uniref:thioredoxin domain-containing protein n=1 Tax=Sphingomonas sp. MMS24-J13 TaxID=3238686 RepID=UPI00384DDDE5